jgi:hypothetical protein
MSIPQHPTLYTQLLCHLKSTTEILSTPLKTHMQSLCHATLI